MSEFASQGGTGRQRPLSPHLQIYKLTPTMAMSIVHRMTGAGLYLGVGGFTVWLMAAASAPECFGSIQGILQSWPGQLALLGLTWALIHHLLGGVKHLIWDTGRGLELEQAGAMSVASLILSVGATAAVWLAAYGLAG